MATEGNRRKQFCNGPAAGRVRLWQNRTGRKPRIVRPQLPSTHQTRQRLPRYERHGLGELSVWKLVKGRSYPVRRHHPRTQHTSLCHKPNGSHLRHAHCRPWHLHRPQDAPGVFVGRHRTMNPPRGELCEGPGAQHGWQPPRSSRQSCKTCQQCMQVLKTTVAPCP